MSIYSFVSSSSVYKYCLVTRYGQLNWTLGPKRKRWWQQHHAIKCSLKHWIALSVASTAEYNDLIIDARFKYSSRGCSANNSLSRWDWNIRALQIVFVLRSLLIGNRMRNLRTLYATKELSFKTGYLLKGRRQQKAVGMECMVPNEHPQQDLEYEQKMKSQSSDHSVCTIQNWCRMVPTWRNHPCLYCNNDWCAKTKMKEDEMVATLKILS